MSRLPLIPPDQAQDPEVLQVYDELKRDFGRISPLFQVSAGHPLILRHVWEDIRSVLLQGYLPRTIKEMILIAISSRNKINYCINMHALSLRNLGVETAVIDALVQNPTQAPLPAATREAVLFALKASADPLGVSDDDIEKLHQAGFSDEEILELIATTNLATSLNTLAAITDIPIPETAQNGAK